MRRKITLYTFALLSCISCNVQETAKPHAKDFEDAYKQICMEHPELGQWITILDEAEGRIFVDLRNDILVFDDIESLKSDTIHYTSKNRTYSVKTCNIEDKDKFDHILKDRFDFSEGSDSVESAQKINEYLNADITTNFISDIDNAGLKWDDKVLSVLYNACVGDKKGHIQVNYLDHKLSFLRANNFPTCYIDKKTFTDIFNTSYEPSYSSMTIDSIFQTGGGIIWLEDFSNMFTYLNNRDDVIIVGDKEINIKDSSIDLLKDSLLSNPSVVYLLTEGYKIVRLKDIIPEYYNNEACIVNSVDINLPQADETLTPVIIQKLIAVNWWYILIGMLIGMIICAIGIWIYKILEKKQKNKKMEVNVEKVIELTNKLIELRNIEDTDDEQIDIIIKEIQHEYEFFDLNFKDSTDLAKWLRYFKSKYSISTSDEEDIPEWLDGLTRDSSTEHILRFFDRKLGTSKEKEYLDFSKYFKKYKALYLSLSNLVKSERPEICKILETLDLSFNLNNKLANEYKAKTAFVDNVLRESQIFESIVSAKSEDELLDELASLRKDYTSIPLIDSVSRLYKESLSSTRGNVLEQIEYILGKMEQYSLQGRPKLSDVVKTYVDKANSYDETKKYIRIESGQKIHDFIRTAVTQFIEDGQTVESAAKFVTKFKQVDKSLKNYEQIIGHYTSIMDVVKGFNKTIESLNKKESIDYWDRLALILCSVSKCAIPLLEETGFKGTLKEQVRQIVLDIKNDLLLSDVSRYFLRDSKRVEVNDSQFLETVTKKLNMVLAYYNKDIVSNDVTTAIDGIPKPINEHISTFKESIMKIRSYESTIIFINSMWDNFVQDFLTNAKKREDSYVIGQALNIAYHTADFLDHIKGGRDIEYCYNFAFLLHNFSVSESGCREFILNDYTKSSAYSNRIYELAEREGVDHLKILIDNYFIKP